MWQVGTAKDSTNYKHIAGFFQRRLFPTLLETGKPGKRTQEVIEEIYHEHYVKEG